MTRCPECKNLVANECNTPCKDMASFSPRHTYIELVKQEYSKNNCKISSGFVDGDPVDTVYLRLEKEGVEPTILHLRPDELAAIAFCCTGTLWSKEVSEIEE